MPGVLIQDKHLLMYAGSFWLYVCVGRLETEIKGGGQKHICICTITWSICTAQGLPFPTFSFSLSSQILFCSNINQKWD